MSFYLLKISIFLFLVLEINGQSATAAPPAVDPTASTSPVLQATTIPSCSLNETFLLCTTCENQCNLVEMDCTNVCGPAMCQCRDGFYRNSTGSCVQGHDCGLHNIQQIQREIPATLPGANLCKDVWCPDGSSCLLIPPQDCQANCGDNATCTTENCIPEASCVQDVLIVYYEHSNMSCPGNETWMDCSSDCENTCFVTQQNCSNICGLPKCQCQDGYYRNMTGYCVQGHDCNQDLSVTQLPSTESIATGCDFIACTNGTICKMTESKAECVLNVTHTCAMNEGWKDCASQCEPSCETHEPACAAICAPSACQCLGGFFRNGNGSCVVLGDCTAAYPTCGANEVVKACGTSCEATCENPFLQCDEDCVDYAQTCQCSSNFVRDPLGDCVSMLQCNESLPTNCSTVTCPLNKVCNIVNGFARCVVEPIPETTLASTTTAYDPFATVITTIATTLMTEHQTSPVTGEGITGDPGFPTESTTINPSTNFATEQTLDTVGTFGTGATDASTTMGSTETTIDFTGTTITATMGPTETTIDFTGFTGISTIAGTGNTTKNPITTGNSTENGTTKSPNPCGKHERETKCKFCEETCRGVKVCTATPTVCTKGCICAYGFVRNSKMKCIKRTQCSKNPGCQANETWSTCLSNEQKCDIVANNTIPIIGQQCFGGCGCVGNFSRNSVGECVTPESCS
ncbi:unnamed protein product, partial [Mesorhabditis belari]|uniref:TIL domain-containing protein n=1 Tax=Mesorhabditis belari TaxID=2138241 RepID=A0AAF3FD49_9BILA